MEIAKSFVTDESGAVKAVMIDVDTYRRIESVLMDRSFGKAMSEVEDDEEVDLPTAQAILQA
ncbi:MAG: antitoxin [Verrucomicrobia bacterium]|nr:antitoxin [Verrucomicrobiota bacterium]